jgi:hypothetical protein
MASYDLTDLRRRVRDRRRRPTGDADLTNTIIDGLLTDAQHYVYGLLASHFPGGGPLRSAAEKMTTSDGGYTYSISNFPVIGRVVVYNHQDLTQKISDSEYFWEGQKTLRWAYGQAQEFADGPYAVYVPQATDVGGGSSTEPTLEPEYMRTLLVEYACWLDATSGNMEDGAPYMEAFQRLFYGGRTPGDLGFLGMLKRQYQGTGARDTRHWWRSPDLSRF